MVGNDWENSPNAPDSSESLPNHLEMSPCPKMSNSDAWLSERTCFPFILFLCFFLFHLALASTSFSCSHQTESQWVMCDSVHCFTMFPSVMLHFHVHCYVCNSLLHLHLIAMFARTSLRLHLVTTFVCVLSHSHSNHSFAHVSTSMLFCVHFYCTCVSS